MVNISTHFGLTARQSDLDFIDVKLEDDNELFIAPRLLEISGSDLIRPMADTLYGFFARLLLLIKGENIQGAKDLLSGIQEPKETGLGYGKFNPTGGRSSGKKMRGELIDSILHNPLLGNRESNLNNLGDLIFFIPNFSRDRLSDMITKIIEVHLIEFTHNQCEKHGIDYRASKQKKKIFNPETLDWETREVELPVFNDGIETRPIIFVPKTIVWNKKQSQRTIRCFYKFARDFIIGQGQSIFLEGIPRNGRNNSILIKDFNKLHPHRKKALTDWVSEYQNIPNDFWLQPDRLVTSMTDAEIGEVVYWDRQRQID
ncbi:MAG: hypothetical protein EOP52_10410 [Sphingobacteriales bacterium]|nr:MAG: hypothetical protein EOP52_10410 [Sphingobacteriales bacterium]